MTIERFSHLFCLIHDSGDVLYPIKMRCKKTGVIAFRVAPHGNTTQDSIELHDEHEVLRHVRDLGFSVRAKSKTTERHGLYKLEQRCITELKILTKATP
jgi:hypothetical protein